jgi:hypothetical protein
VFVLFISFGCPPRATAVECMTVDLGREACFLSRGATGPVLPLFSSRCANCLLN